MNVYFLGPSGSFSSILARQHFASNQYTLQSSSTFEEIRSSVMADPLGIGVLPIENSITSNVHENIDSLFSAGLFIVGEAYLQVSLHLMGLEGATLKQLKKIYSHPKALQQCSLWLARLQDVEQVPCRSTSDACALVVEEANSENAFIGATALSSEAGVKIIESNVGNVKQNTTRFVFVSQNSDAIHYERPEKVSLTFKTPHQPGSLAKILSDLAAIPVNLTKIVSQPIPGSDFEYKFWIDLESSPENIPIALDTIAKKTPEYTVIGTYSSGSRYKS